MTDQEKQYFEQNVNEDDGRIDLITTTYYRWELTEKCLDYLFGRTLTFGYRLTVVDNGSKDETVKNLMSLKQGGYIENLILLDRNYGLEFARNIALKLTHSEYCVFFDNDLLCPDLTPDWLSQQLALIKRYPEFDVIALRPQIAVGADNSKFNTDKEVVENNHVGATFMMFKTAKLKEVGWDNEFSNRAADLRLEQKGLKMGWARDIYCQHIWGKNWSYPEAVEHFHREIYPPPEHYDNIKVDPKTLKPL